MAKLINVGFGNVVNSRKIVAVVSPDAAPVKRMIQSVKGTRTLIDATQGRKTKAVIVTSDDYLVLSALQPETIARRFSEGYGEEMREEAEEARRSSSARRRPTARKRKSPSDVYKRQEICERLCCVYEVPG